MKPFEIKIARKVITTPDYRTKRMERMGREIAYWIGCENTSHSARQREFCRSNQQMFFRRYAYYLNR